MSTKLFVGKLSYSTTDSNLQQHFAQSGTVVSAKVIIDKYSGQGKGFGFVEMATEEEAKRAMDQLNNSNLDGRTIVVSQARPQSEKRDGYNNFGHQNRQKDFRRSKRW